MKQAFVLLEGDVVRWAHAQAAAKGTSVSTLLSELLREQMRSADQSRAFSDPNAMVANANGGNKPRQSGGQ